MSIIDTLLATVAPLECIVCNQEGYLLCPTCITAMEFYKPSECFSCFKPTSNNFTYDSCFIKTGIRSVSACYAYKDTAKQAVGEFKFNGKRAAAKDLARIMSERAQNAKLIPDPNIILVHIPTATSRVRERGYDHAKLLARALSHNLGLLQVDALTRTKQGHQVGLGRVERSKHIAGAFRVPRPQVIAGAHILLVDDVVTTGATLSEAAKVLLQAGAMHVDALVFAKTPPTFGQNSAK